MLGIEMAFSRKAISEQRRKSIAPINSQIDEGTFIPRPSYGYRLDDKGRFHVVETEKAVILEMYRMCLAKESMNAISEYFNKAGVSGKRGARYWTHRQIKIVLTNPAYIGKYNYRDLHETTLIPPIVTKEMRELAAEMLAIRSYRRAPSKRHLLSGLVVCSYCSERVRKGVQACPTMIMNIQKQGPKGNKKKYAYFFCQSQNRSLFCCEAPRVREDDLDAVVEGMLVPYILEKHSKRMGSDAYQESLNKLEVARTQLRSLNRRTDELEESFASDELKPQEYLRLRDKNQAKAAATRAEISTLLRMAESVDPGKICEALDVLQMWREMPIDRRRDAIRAFIESIEVSADWVTFHVNPIASDKWSFNVRLDTIRKYREKPLIDPKKHVEWTLDQAGYANQEPCPKIG